MYVARAAIERAAAEQILRSGRGDTAAEALLEVVAQMREANRSHRIADTTEADMRYHQLLVELAHSPRLSRIHSTLLTETRICITALEDSYRFGDDRVDEHRAIAEAFRSDSGSPKPDGQRRTLVDRLLVDHMDDALRRLSASEAEAPDADGVTV